MLFWTALFVLIQCCHTSPQQWYSWTVQPQQQWRQPETRQQWEQPVQPQQWEQQPVKYIQQPQYLQSETGGNWLQQKTTEQPEVPNTPCPLVFNYEHDGGQWVGVAMVTPPLDPSSRNQSIKLLLTLTVPAVIATNFAGKLELYDDKNLVLQRLQSGGHEVIKYRVLFPTQSPLPVLNSLQVNANIVCQGDKSGGPGSTTLSLSHRLTAFINWQALPRPPPPPTSSPGTQQGTRALQTTPSSLAPRVTTLPPRISRPTARPAVSKQQPLNEECGTVVQGLNLIVNGASAEKDQWPWLTAMFAKTETGLEFQCGGSLVTRRHVVTAAHCCVLGSQEVRKADTLLVYLGKFNLHSWTETNTQPRDVLEVVMHPSYEAGSAKSSNDVALLVLSAPAHITNSVRPVCLWQPRSQHFLLDSEGTVVGWGRDEKGNRVSAEPRMVKMPLVSQEECLRSHRNFYYLTSDTTFCAGGKDGSGPCSGDSGGGMYFHERSPDGSTYWTLRGVVSLALPDDTKICDLSNYVVFTDIAKVTSWVIEVITR